MKRPAPPDDPPPHSWCVQASSTVRCLSNVLPHLKGRRGARGGKQGSAGARGEDYTVLVPVGTRVWVSAGAAQM